MVRSEDFVFQCRGSNSIPDGEEKIPHAFWPKNENIKQKQYHKKFTMKKLLLSLKKKKDTRKGNQNSCQLNKSPIPITRVSIVSISLSLNDWWNLLYPWGKHRITDWKCRAADGNKASKTILPSTGNQVSITTPLFNSITTFVTLSKCYLIRILELQGTLGLSLFSSPHFIKLVA